jgi:hypothetical protein
VPERPLHPYQQEFGRAVIHSTMTGAAREITALFARQSGKTETVARIVVALLILLPALARERTGFSGSGHTGSSQLRAEIAFANRFSFSSFLNGVWVGVFAPVKEQAVTAFERLSAIVASQRVQCIFGEFELTLTTHNKNELVLSNGSSVRIASTMPGTHIESKTLHVAIVEEAQDVSAVKIRKSIEPMLTATAGTLVMVGTANTLKSLFWETIQHNRQHAYEHPTQPNNHFQYDWMTVIQHNPRYRAFMNAKVLSRGRGWVDSDAFKMAYGCEFILERGQFMSFERLVELEKMSAQFERGPYDAHGLCKIIASTVAGIDWGKSGDSTVATVIARYDDRYRIVDWLELSGDDYDSQFNSLVGFLRKFPTLKRVLSETNGVGDPMTDRLKKAARVGRLNAQIAGFVASEAHNGDGYKNLMLDFVHGNRLYLPACEESRQSREYTRFVKQLTSVVKEWRGSLLKVHAVGREHDDYVSSLMIAYWAASKTGSPDLFTDFYHSLSPA